MSRPTDRNPKHGLGARMRIFVVEITSRKTEKVRHITWVTYGLDLIALKPNEPKSFEQELALQRYGYEAESDFELIVTYDLQITDLFQLAQIETYLRELEADSDHPADPLGDCAVGILNQFHEHYRLTIEELRAAGKLPEKSA